VKSWIFLHASKRNGRFISSISGFLPEGKMRIMNKYIAGLFKNIRTTEFRIWIAVAVTGIRSLGV
jgi:hypothetical protein